MLRFVTRMTLVIKRPKKKTVVWIGINRFGRNGDIDSKSRPLEILNFLKTT